MPRAIGIDFGTANTVVAAVQRGKPVIIANAEGSLATPSVVALTEDGQWLAGDMAKRQAVLNPRKTIFSVKRFLGKRYDETRGNAALVPHQIVRGPNDTVRIQVEKNLYSPEEIAALLLRKLADDASHALGEKVEEAVIAVPTTFTHAQRQAIWDAGKIAGLNVLQLINEPTAAAMAYSVERKKSATVMVFDAGSGACEISIVDVGGGVCEVRASAGDFYLGGDAFDSYLADYVAKVWKTEQQSDLRSDQQTLQRLYEAVERAKCELSSTMQTTLHLPYLMTEVTGLTHLNLGLTRSQLEALVEPLTRRCTDLVEQALADATVSRKDIDEVLLVGGVTRMPVVQVLLKRLMGDKEPTLSVNPNDVVALGAAMQAEVLKGTAENVLVFDVTPLSLSVETHGGVRAELIEHNTTIPCRKTKVFSTAEDNQSVVDIVVLQGMRGLAADARQIGHVRLEGIQPAPRGVPQIEVTFDIDTNGILSISARDRDLGKVHGVTISNAPNLERGEVERLRHDTALRATQRGQGT